MPIEVKGDLGCHIWTGHLSKDGLPMVRTRDGYQSVRRRNWEREYGPIPEGRKLIPLCGSHLCVRALHLEPVTARQMKVYTGEMRRTPDLERRALHLRRTIGESRRSTARLLGISARTVERIEQDNPESEGEAA